MELIYDSKAHEAIAAAGGAISPYPFFGLKYLSHSL
jgi:hypothetical protein